MSKLIFENKIGKIYGDQIIIINYKFYHHRIEKLRFVPIHFKTNLVFFLKIIG